MGEVQRFDEEDMLRRLGCLPRSHVQLYAASCAQSLQDSYVDFFRVTGRGDPARLQASLDLAWQAAAETPEASAIEAALASSEGLVPEENEFWVDASANAQCAASAVYYALRYAQDGELESAVAPAEQEYQAADQAVLYEIDADEFTPELESQVLADPRVQGVLCRQLERIRLVEDAFGEGASVQEVTQRLRVALSRGEAQ